MGDELKRVFKQVRELHGELDVVGKEHMKLALRKQELEGKLQAAEKRLIHLVKHSVVAAEPKNHPVN